MTRGGEKWLNTVDKVTVIKPGQYGGLPLPRPGRPLLLQRQESGRDRDPRLCVDDPCLMTRKAKNLKRLNQVFKAKTDAPVLITANASTTDCLSLIAPRSPPPKMPSPSSTKEDVENRKRRRYSPGNCIFPERPRSSDRHNHNQNHRHHELHSGASQVLDFDHRGNNGLCNYHWHREVAQSQVYRQT
ncbi:uncharacterized protein [Panulirus ornatus]|uniref:uncharacterized protein n=1 Tax=Panulirus ornatus TaxID=150431 RepID=UPI003A84D0A7